MKKILFVCTGNTCRSLMAEYLMEKLLKEEGLTGLAEVTSAGTSASPMSSPPEAFWRVIKKEGIEWQNHHPRQLERSLIEEADLILVMEKMHRDRILRDFPTSKERVYLLNEFAGLGEKEILDPVGCSYEAYETCLSQIKSALKKVIERLVEKN